MVVTILNSSYLSLLIIVYVWSHCDRYKASEDGESSCAVPAEPSHLHQLPESWHVIGWYLFETENQTGIVRASKYLDFCRVIAM